MLKRIRRHPAMRWVAWVAAITTGGIQLIPTPVHARPRPHRQYVNELKDGLTDKPDAALRAKIAAREAAARSRPDARALSGKEMRAWSGKGPYRNQYLSGAAMPWHKSFRDVNLSTGNLFRNFTDMQLKPARGAGLVLNRTYNSRDDRVGPFGIGWTHAYDIRVQEAGNDNVPRTDFFGGKHTYKRDADGLYSPPAYAYDVLSSDYDKMLADGPPPVLSDTDCGMAGTVKHFVANGSERACDYIEDRHGNRTTLTYGPTATMPDGTSKRLLTQVTDPSSRSITFTWTNLGTNQQPAWRITQVVGPLYRVTYDYYINPSDAASYLNLQAVHLDPDGINRTTYYSYTSFSGPSGVENGLLSAVTDGLGHTTSYQYGLPQRPFSGLDHPVINTVWVLQVNEPSTGGQYTWHILPELTYYGTPYPNLELWTGVYSYPNLPNAPGEMISVIVGSDAGLRVNQIYWGNHYPNAGRQVYAATYDTSNNLLSQTIATSWDPIGHPDGVEESRIWTTTRSTYGPHGNVLTQSTDGFAGQTTYTYYNKEKYFQKASVTDANGHTSAMDYYACDDPSPGNRGELMWARDARYSATGRQATCTYNQYGQKLAETDLNGVVTQYTYGDAWGNATQVMQDAGPGRLNRTTQMTYDEAGNVLASTDPSGRNSSFTYNTLGQPLTATAPATNSSPSETVTYGYGANGRTESVTDGRGTTTVAYEPGNDRVSTVADPVVGAMSYTYGPSGEKRSVALPGGGTWTYQYAPPHWYVYKTTAMIPGLDPNKLSVMPMRIVDDQGRAVDFTLDQAGGPHAVRTNQVYDQGGSLRSYCETVYTPECTSGGQTRGQLAALATSYNTVINDVWQSHNLSANAYTYDSTGQRLTNTITDQTGAQRTETYRYDELNRLTAVNYGDGEVQGYTFDPMGNRLTKTDNVTGNESYGYNNANMLTSRNGQAYTNDPNGNTLTGGGRTMTWDGQNRMVTCQYNGNTSSFVYGSDGLRRRVAVSGVTTDFALDGQTAVRELRAGSPVATYLYGPRGPEYRRDDECGQVRWYAYDGFGGVVGEVDPNGNLTSTRAHDVYGCVRQTSGTRTSKHGFAGGLGHPSDEETGLVYMRARYMDPGLGRFASEDPARDGGNWLAYCRGNPSNAADATGRSPERWAAFNALLAQWTEALRESEAFRLDAPGFLKAFDGMTALLDAFQGGSGRMSPERLAYNELVGAYELATAEPAIETEETYVAGFGKGYVATVELFMWFLSDD